MIGIVYHKDYNKYDLGSRHPLVGDKPKRTIEFFEEKNIMKKIKLFTPKKVSENNLLLVHNQQYINRIKKLSQTGGVLAFDTPVPVGIYEIARLSTGGTILGGKKLFSGFQCMANPLAGFHHASRSISSGFCFFNDLAIVIEYLRENHKLERFLVVDLDVHHANGTEEIYYDDPSVLLISFHQDGRTLYPGTGFIEKIGRDSGEGFNVNLPLPPGTGSPSYLKAFDDIVPPLTMEFDPELIIYQCGVDTHHSDPLASLSLVHQTYYYLGKKMRDLSNKSCKKLLILFGGGYNCEACVKSYYNIMCGLLDKKEYIKEKETSDIRAEIVKKIVTQLKQKLSPCWDL
jgi:acetoin utilization deacetylase AcuC-like enzyme